MFDKTGGDILISGIQIIKFGPNRVIGRTEIIDRQRFVLLHTELRQTDTLVIPELTLKRESRDHGWICTDESVLPPLTGIINNQAVNFHECWIFLKDQRNFVFCQMLWQIPLNILRSGTFKLCTKVTQSNEIKD